MIRTLKSQIISPSFCFQTNFHHRIRKDPKYNTQHSQIQYELHKNYNICSNTTFHYKNGHPWINSRSNSKEQYQNTQFLNYTFGIYLVKNFYYKMQVFYYNVLNEFIIIFQSTYNKRIMLKQPATQVKMTNVAYIKYKINNKNFEIACYRNKALNWRNGVQQDLSEVLQIDQIYQNASHGTLAKKADLNKFFPNKTKKDIIEIILERGELQISDKEREVQQSNITGDIIKIIVQKCVNPVTKRRFTFQNIKQALKDIHFAVKTDQPAKKQALQCIKLLQKRYKIARGEMRVKISFQKQKQQTMSKKLKQLQISQPITQDAKNNLLSRVYDIQPSKYRDLSQLCKQQNNTTVQVVMNVVVNTEHKDLQSQSSGALELLDQFKLKGEQNEKFQQKRQQKMNKQFQNLNISEDKRQKAQDKRIKCSTCGQGASFSTTHQHRQHFKSEWHVQNVKRKSKNLPIFSQEEYQVQVFNKNYK